MLSFLFGSATLGLSFFNLFNMKHWESSIQHLERKLLRTEIQSITRNFRNQVTIVQNILVGVKQALINIRNETHRYFCFLAAFQQRTTALFHQFSTNQKLLLLISDVLNSKMSFRILEIPQADS